MNNKPKTWYIRPGSDYSKEFIWDEDETDGIIFWGDEVLAVEVEAFDKIKKELIAERKAVVLLQETLQGVATTLQTLETDADVDFDTKEFIEAIRDNVSLVLNSVAKTKENQ